MAATSDSIPIHIDYYAAQFAKSRRVDGIWWIEVDVRPEQVVDDRVEGERHSETIDKEESIPGNDSNNLSGSS